jgi:prepilin-type N-terminal cleavage/methylation domain-containing protein
MGGLAMKIRHGGFTLIELLVVIAIIAILAAILFPVFVSAKNAASLASCQSNIKQLGMAISMYSDASDGRLPPYDNGKTGLNRLMWFGYIDKYLKTGKIYRCTALTDPKVTSTAAGKYNRIYGYGVPAPHLFSSPAPSPKMGAIPRQSKTMLLCDDYTMDRDPAGNLVECGFPVVYCRCTGGATGHSWSYTAQYMPDGNIAGRHGGQSNRKPWGKTVVLYCDMHAKNYPKEYVAQEYTSLADCKNDDMWGHFDNIVK